MASSIQIKRGITANVAAYTPLAGELVLDTTTKKLYAGDGTTAGGNQIVASKKGAIDASNAAAGELGEVITNQATTVAMTTATAVTLTSIVLTPGDWDVAGVVETFASGFVVTLMIGSLGTAAATNQAFPNRTRLEFATATGSQAFAVPSQRFNVSQNTTIYLVAQATFSSGTVTGSGFIRARRVR